MEFFKIKRDIPFMRHALIFNVISALTFVAAVFFLVHKGLHFSVEFTGGTKLELRYPHAADQEKIRHQLETLGYEAPEVTSFGTAQDIMLRLPVLKGKVGDGSTAVFNALCASEGGASRQIDTVTPKGEHIAKAGCFNAAGAECPGVPAGRRSVQPEALSRKRISR